MGDSKLFRFISILLVLITFSGWAAFDPENPKIEDYLLNHVVYGKSHIKANWGCRSPKSGIMGTPNTFKQTGDFHFQTESFINDMSGSGITSTVKNNSTLEYVIKDATSFTVEAGSAANKVNYVYKNSAGTADSLPVFPVLSSLNFTGADGIASSGTKDPGNYSKLDVGSGGTINLNAGTYYFGKIEVGYQGKINILPVNGSYATNIYVDGTITLNAQAKLLPQADEGLGQILIAKRGTGNITFTGDNPDTPTEIAATIIAEQGHVFFNNGAKLHGQVMADTVEFIGFDGGKGIDFKKLIKANIKITPPTSINEDSKSPMEPNVKNDNVSTITAELSAAVPTGKNSSGEDNKVTIKWQLIDGDQKWDVDYKSTDGKNGTFEFLAGEKEKSINLTIIDETTYDPNQSFSIRFYDAADNIDDYTIDFGGGSTDTTHSIIINNDDLDNTAPKTISLSPASIDEEEAIGATVGIITVTDDEESPFESKVEVTSSTIPLAPFTVVKSGTGASTTFTLVSTAKFDYEAGPRYYDVELTATDAGDLTKTSVIRVNINPINDIECVATKATFSVDEDKEIVDQSLLGYLTDGDSVAANNRFKYEIIQNPLHSSTFSPPIDGSKFSYKPNPALEVVKDSFSYRVIDSATYDGSNGHKCPETWVIININSVNDNDPVTINRTLVLKEGETDTTLANLFTDADINDSHVLKVVSQSEPTAGTATDITGHKIQYVTTSDVTVEKFTDIVTFSITDNGGTGTTVQGTLTVTIEPQNDNAPEPTIDTITVIQGVNPLPVDIITQDHGNGIDKDKDLASNLNDIKIFSITGEDNTYCDGLTFSGKTITYKVKDNVIIPPAGIIDELNNVIMDPIIGTPPYDTDTNKVASKVIIKIQRNEANKPIAENDLLELQEGKIATTLKNGSNNVITNNDAKKVADLDRVEILAGSGPFHHKAFTLNSDGTFSYEHNDSENFQDSVQYILFDKAGLTDTAKIIITILPLNDNQPTIKHDTITLSEGTKYAQLVIDSSATAEWDVDINTSFYTTIKTYPQHGTVTPVSENGKQSTYEYSLIGKDVNGIYSDFFVLSVTDSTAYDTDSTYDDTVFVVIEASNDNEPIVKDTSAIIKEQESITINLASLISDADMPDDKLTLAIKDTTTTGAGKLIKVDDTTVTYQASPDKTVELFSDVVSYTITDDAPTPHVTTGTITLTIGRVNDNDPIAKQDIVTITVGKTETILPIANDSDIDTAWDQTTLGFSSKALSIKSTLPNTVLSKSSNTAISLKYDISDVTGPFEDSIWYEVKDPASYEDASVFNTSTGLIVVTVELPDSAKPVANDDAIQIAEDSTTSVLSLPVGGTSVMDNDSAFTGAAPLDSVRLITDGTHGTFVFTNGKTGAFTYTHNPTGPAETPAQFTDFVEYELINTSGDINSRFDTARVNITVDMRNDNKPVVNNDVLTVAEGGSGNIDVTTNDSDIDLQTIWVTAIKSQGTHGTVTLESNGTFTYTHNGSENFSDVFWVYISDSTLYDQSKITKDSSQVTVTITPVNDNDPVVRDTTMAAIKEGQKVVVDVAGLISDPDEPNDSLTVAIVNPTTPAGSATINGTEITYTHDINTEIFADEIIFAVSDTSGVNPSVNGKISITILPINDNIPAIVNDTISVRQGTPLTFTVTGNDTDADLPADSTFLKILSNGLATRGTVVKVDDSTFTYTMDINFEIIDGVSDVDSFTYIITDSVGYDTKVNTSPAGMVYINLLHDEQGYPKTLNDSLNIKENDSITTSWSIMDNDTMGFAALKSINIVDNVDHGTLTVDPVTGTFTYDHDDDKEEFSDQFIYTLTDSVGNVSNAALVSITIDTLNDNEPDVANETLSVDEGATATINILTTETDKDIATTLTPTLLGANGGAKHGTVTVTADGTLTYVQDGVEGVTADTVIINITDVTTYDIPGLHTVPDTVFITVNPLNNNDPVGTAKNYTLKEGETLTITDSLQGLLHDATDPDLINGNTLSAVLVTKPFYHNEAVAPFTLNANGTFTYIHDDSENFSDSLVFDISDGVNTLRLTATFSIAPINDNAPVALDDKHVGVEGGTISPVASVLENDSDIDLYLDGLGGTIQTPLHAVLDSMQLPTQGSVSMTPDGLFTYTHNGSETVNDSFAYIAVDTMQGITFTDTAKVYLTIPQVAPTADTAFYYDEDGNGKIEKAIIYFNDSINVSTTTFAASWDEDAAVVTVVSAVNSGTNGTEVTLTLDGSVEHRTSGLLSIAITHGALFDNLAASIKALDRAAPTIRAATYYYDETGNDNDSLRVFFSEDVDNFLGNPYNYFDVSTGAEFSMEITQQSHVGSVMTYAVNSKTIKHVNTGDSIQINLANIALDTLENYQDSTIWAPITLEGKYPQELELLVVPQPMLFVKVTDKKSEAAALNVDMMEYYNFPANVATKGVAFILTGKVPLGDISLQKGTYVILDQTGNVVQEAQPMSFTVSEEGKVTGVAVWEGTNKNGRTVAKSSYLCIVTVEVITENGETITKEFKKPIATFGIYE